MQRFPIIACSRLFVAGLLLSGPAVCSAELRTTRTQADSTENVESGQTHWRAFRGTLGQGLSNARGLPVKWTTSKNVRWKTRIPGLGWSSPVTDGKTVWLTSSEIKGGRLFVYGVDFASGQITHEIEVFRKNELGRIHAKNSHATPTIALCDDRLIAHFGAHGTVCLSLDGRILWKVEMEYYHHHGPGSSPVVEGDRVFLVCDGYEGPFYDDKQRNVPDRQFVIALDLESGRTIWRQPRKGRHAYATPLIVSHPTGSLLISPGGDRVVAYNAADGTESWSCRFEGYSLVACPVTNGESVLVSTGYDDPELLAIRMDGTGDVTDSGILWKLTEGAPLNSSPLIVDNRVYFVNDKGIAQCLDVRTGERLWRARLGGNYSASPIYADGLIYFMSETGVVHVVRAAASYERVALNRMKSRTFASPAVCDRSLLIRTERMLFRLETTDP